MSRKSEHSFDNDSSAESQTLLSEHYSDFSFKTDVNDPNASNRQCSCGKSTFMKWASIFCAICTMTNLVLGFLPTKPVSCQEELASVSRSQLSQLRRPSPYIGLDQVVRDNSSTPNPIINFPHVIAQVDKTLPSKIFDDDPLRYMSISGMVSPQKHEVRTTDSISTVFQFRAIDFGMERCELRIQFAPLNVNTSPPLELAIHKLDSASYIDTKTLSYQTRPRRAFTLDTIALNTPIELNWSHNFTCSWDELMTFELACADYSENANKPCIVSWWQDEEDENPSPGIFIRQHPTI